EQPHARLQEHCDVHLEPGQEEEDWYEEGDERRHEVLERVRRASNELPIVLGLDHEPGAESSNDGRQACDASGIAVDETNAETEDEQSALSGDARQETEDAGQRKPSYSD